MFLSAHKLMLLYYYNYFMFMFQSALSTFPYPLSPLPPTSAPTKTPEGTEEGTELTDEGDIHMEYSSQ